MPGIMLGKEMLIIREIMMISESYNIVPLVEYDIFVKGIVKTFVSYHRDPFFFICHLSSSFYVYCLITMSSGLFWEQLTFVS